MEVASWENGAGHGGAARGYKWADAEPGNLLAEKSGFWIDPLLREEHRVELEEIGVQVWALLPFHVRRQWLRTGEYGPTKTPAGVRVLPLPPDLRDLLIALRLRSRFSADTDPIFASHTGRPLGHWNVPARGFAPARDLAGLPKSVTFHCLRDAAASRLINAGLDVVAVATFLGHEDATTTLRKYARLFDRRRTGDAVRDALAGAVMASGEGNG